jgi:glycosyltransferase involved in cell wall biosynthesis
VFPFAEKAKIALYSGRLHHKKGLDLLPQVMSGLDEAGHRDLHLAFVGGDEDGTLRELSTEFARNGLLERVVFLPTATSAGLRAAYSGADVLLLPSRHENFGNVVVEALACGCPVMISDQVGAAEFVGSLPGVRVLARDAARWGGALKRFVSEPFEEVSVDCVHHLFARDAVAKKMESAYFNALTASPIQ